MNNYANLEVNQQGRLQIGGMDAVHLAERFGTPLYVLAEEAIRTRCRAYQQALAAHWGDGAIAYAGKALMTLAICRIMDEENMWLDVASGGELYVALQAGFPAQRIFFHGNNKSPEELKMGVEAGVGRFVCDNFDELDRLQWLGGQHRRSISVMLRVTPGIDTVTHRYIRTGGEDSKFGFGLAAGEAMTATRQVLGSRQLRLQGFHCHLGSQLLQLDGLTSGAEVMVDFMSEVRRETSFVAGELNLGGGLGIAYTPTDRPPSVERLLLELTGALKEAFARHDFPLPLLYLEPGRSIVGEAGVTLYTVGSIKENSAGLTYLLVDGGMADNPRPSLYGARYSAVLAQRANEAPTQTVQVAGKCCESGDILLRDAHLPSSQIGDVLAVFCTGAYNHAMASNYNRLLRPAMVLVNQGEAELIVERERYAHLILNERMPTRLLPAQRAVVASLP